jgi:hypothetical protein
MNILDSLRRAAKYTASLPDVRVVCTSVERDMHRPIDRHGAYITSISLQGANNAITAGRVVLNARAADTRL